MKIVIDIDGPEPLFAQLIEQIKRAVQSGELVAGEPLPSIRQLANDLEINNKTVAKAYRLLERDSVVQTKGYRGTFVHPDAKANSAVDLGAWIASRLGGIVAELRQAGATDSEIRIAFGNVINERSN
jgi:DNA-binding transcriptional regulator YhcF (GntR family)